MCGEISINPVEISRLLSFGKNNAAIQSLVHRHLLRPSAASAAAPLITQLLNPTEKALNIAEISGNKKKSDVDDKIGGFFPFEMMGFSGVDRSGILQARVDSDGSFDFVSETEIEDSDGDFGFDFDHDGAEDEDEDDDDDDGDYSSCSDGAGVSGFSIR